MREAGLDARLMSAVSFVRQGAVFADIGTDHAYLPIFLVREGIVTRAVCADINKGPLTLAEANVASSGLDASLFDFVLTDGARELSDRGITDYAVCGMGGELISYIISAAEHLKNKGVRLILQPMSKQAHLRRYLCETGFDIVGEKYSFSEGKYYLTLAAEYSGRRRDITEVEAELGSLPEKCDTPCALGYFEGKEKSYTVALMGKEKAGIDTSQDREILTALKERITLLKERTEQ